MAIDATIREANVKDSLRKYLVEAARVAGLPIVFDKGMEVPKSSQGQPLDVDKWVSIKWGDFFVGSLAVFHFTIFVLSRKDNEGYKLSQTRDKVYDWLLDTSQTDTCPRIKLYRSVPGVAASSWEVIGGMMLQVTNDFGKEYTASDGTKFKYATCRVVWGAVA